MAERFQEIKFQCVCKKKKKETQQNHKGIPVIFSLFKFKYAIAVSVEIAYYNLSSALR